MNHLMVAVVLALLMPAAAYAQPCISTPAQSANALDRKAGDYPLTEDSQFHKDIVHGKLEGPFEFHSKIIAGTVRRYWIYVPYNYDAKSPPNLLVYQDGQRAINPAGSERVPVVLDNLIAKGDIPATLGIFITPGNVSEGYPDDLGMKNPNHRAEEYDALDDTFSRFLIEEMLPEVGKAYAFSSDPARRIIAGGSSGGIVSFTVAWRHPEAFGNVISFIGSYTSIGMRPQTVDTPFVPGGDTYPGLIRKSPIRPLRIFLQDGSHDLDNEHGNWFLANQQMVAAIKWANANADAPADKRAGPITQDQTARYDLCYVWGDGGHNGEHGGHLLPDVLRWLGNPPDPVKSQ